nr:MAG TPA: Endodeoxyribonuclease RusA [Caudoviricetes sp.]
MRVNEFDITPVPKPRMTQRDKWQKRPSVMRYRAFCDEARLRRIMLPESGAEIVFQMPMPKSWSGVKRRSMAGQPHQQKPDVDNLLKALMDALFDDDCKVWNVAVSKVWGESGKITVRLPEKSTIHELITIG